MVVAALVVSGEISPDNGSDFMIQLSIVQVALAIPEQIIGVMKSTVLAKKGNPKEEVHQIFGIRVLVLDCSISDFMFCVHSVTWLQIEI